MGMDAGSVSDVVVQVAISGYKTTNMMQRAANLPPCPKCGTKLSASNGLRGPKKNLMRIYCSNMECAVAYFEEVDGK